MNIDNNYNTNYNNYNNYDYYNVNEEGPELDDD